MSPEIIVVLDAMGVIYQPGADVDDLLIPFVREQGCAKTDSEIVDLYDDASRGLLNTRELWERLGVAGKPDLLDREITNRYSLTFGLNDFLGYCDDSDIPVACISNDISEWATLRAQSFGLSNVIASWTISGDVGHRKPDEAIYDAFLSAVSADATCIFVDDRLANVVASEARGMRGVLFGPDPTDAPQSITTAPDFSSLADLIAMISKACDV